MIEHTTETAPELIWLQADAAAHAGGAEGDDKSFPGEKATWCGHSVGGLEVKYVRADLAHAALVQAEAALADIGDAEGEPDITVAWCERRAAKVLSSVRELLFMIGRTR